MWPCSRDAWTTPQGAGPLLYARPCRATTRAIPTGRGREPAPPFFKPRWRRPRAYSAHPHHNSGRDTPDEKRGRHQAKPVVPVTVVRVVPVAVSAADIVLCIDERAPTHHPVALRADPLCRSTADRNRDWRSRLPFAVHRLDPHLFVLCHCSLLKTRSPRPRFARILPLGGFAPQTPQSPERLLRRRIRDSESKGFRDQRYRRAAHGGMVEVGTALAGRPPHSSGRAELPHPALALGLTLARCDTARRMRSTAWYISLLRPCVRDMWPCRPFPLAGRLPSIPSAPFGLFGDFVGTMQPSDCPRPFIIGLRP
jgi:hypothetical protein